MAGAPAYRYDRIPLAGSAPARQTAPAPSVRVVPGRKQTANPPLSDTAVVAIKALIACFIVFLALGFVRVGLASAAYSLSSEATTLQAEIADARSTSESLAVQESLLSSPSNIKTQAQERLSMSAATSSETITLSADPVSIDSAGNLSFAGSVSRLAQG